MFNKRPTAFIFGAGNVGEYILPFVQEKYEVIAFLDNDKAKLGKKLKGVDIYTPEAILDSDYNIVVIASLAGVNRITEQLINLGVNIRDISTEYVDLHVKARIVFLEKLAELFQEQDIAGAIAECGVFQGEFASEINRLFPNKKLYLFDTFSGFDARDVLIEQQRGYSDLKTGHFNITNEEIVLSKLPFPDMVIIRKGYFPETTEGINEIFCFVNLDFDLYQPTLEGLNYFYPRMAKGGLILVHDYFSVGYKGVRQAVDEFKMKTEGVQLLPIGDGLSIAIHI